MNARNWRKTHLELPLKQSSSNSSMSKCLPTWRNQKTRRTWRMERMNRLCRILKGVGTESIGSPRWIANRHCDATGSTTNPPKSPNQLATIAKSQVTIKISAVNSSKKRTTPETTRIVPTIPTKSMVVVKQTLTPTVKFPTISTQTNWIIKKTENLHLSAHLLRPVANLTTPQRNVTLEQTQLLDRLLGIDGRKDKTKSSREMLKAT